MLLLFAISFAFNATPFFGGPYTLVATTILLQTGVTPISFITVSIVTGLGAALSKSVMYIVGITAKKPLDKNKNVRFIKRIGTSRGLLISLFIASVIPFLPMDDFLYLAGGAAKLNLAPMLEISIIAKVIKSVIEIGTEIAGITGISELIHINPVDLGLISIVVFTVLGYILFKIDWEMTYNKVVKYIRQVTHYQGYRE